jgi:hypothetical protein
LKTPEDYVRVGKAFKGAWNCAAIFEATATPWLTPAELHDMGFSQIAYPNILIGRVVKAIEHGLHRLAQLAAGEDNAFKNERAGNGTKEPAGALDLQKWKGPGKEIFVSLAMMLWGAQCNVANDEVGQLPKQEQTDNRIAVLRNVELFPPCITSGPSWPAALFPSAKVGRWRQSTAAESAG